MPKTALVTGATAGIGLETVRALRARGWTVYLHGRTPQKARAAAEPLGALPVAADLSVRAEIDALADQLLATTDRLDALINNAGVWNSHQTYTAGGVEQTFFVNHLAPFLLSHRLLPVLRRTPHSRLICLASDSHKQIKGMFTGNYNLEGNYHGLRSYAQSKLANVLFCYEYERRRPGPDYPDIYAVQPGLVQTDIGLKGNTWLHRLAWRVRRQMSGHKTPAEGAATSVFLATDEGPGTQGKSGLYWDDCAPKSSYGASYDAGQAAELWEDSLRMLGLHSFF